MATINQTEYAWSDVSVTILGKELQGITGIEYTSSQEKEVVYGRGNQPRGIQKGNKKHEGILSVLQSELESLLLTVGSGKNLTDLPAFDIIVKYQPEGLVPVIIDRIQFAEFTENKKMLKQNDKFMAVDLPFVALDILYAV